MPIDIAPIPTQDLSKLPYTLQEWIRQINRLLWTSTGAIPVTSGGTGLSSVAQGDLLYGSAVNVYSLLNKTATDSYLGNSGGSNNPAWQAKAALTKTDDTNVTLTLGGTPTTSLMKAVSLTLGWTGQLSVSRGGTGLSSSGSTGQILRSNGVGFTMSTAAYPNTGTVNQIPYWSATNVLSSGIANLTYDGETFGVIRGSSSSTANTATISKTTTVTSGTRTNLRSIFTVNPASDGGASYLSFYNTAQYLGAVNLPTSLLRGANYEALHIGTGTLGTLDALTALVQQSAGAGAVTSMVGATGNLVVQATTGAASAFKTSITMNNAAAALTTYVGFDSTGVGTLTAGAALTNALGMRIGIMGKTGVTHAIGLAINNQAGAATTNVNLLLGTVTPPGITASIYNSSTNDNQHAGNSFFGGTTTPTAKAHFGASTTAASSAPWKAVTGALMTTAEPGAYEYVDPDHFLTIAGPSRKGIILDDGTRLTSGIIPIATTNGRLIDGPTPVTDGTYTFDATIPGNVDSITVDKGLITTVTVVP